LPFALLFFFGAPFGGFAGTVPVGGVVSGVTAGGATGFAAGAGGLVTIGLFLSFLFG
jgi:hypothetical protein